MTLPNYKNIIIKNPTKDSIFEQLSRVNWSQSPMVLTVSQLEENQFQALEHIDSFFNERPKINLPYAIYVLGDCPDYTGPLYITSEIGNLPKFYNFKSRSLNTKESSMMNKVLLKRENLSNLRSSEYLPILESYAKEHKKINFITQELEYLKNLNMGLDKYYGKEK